MYGESETMKTESRHRRLRPRKFALAAQESDEQEPLCIEFTIQMHAETGSDATAMYNHLNYIFETEPAQVETIKSIQQKLNSLAGDHFPEFTNGNDIEIVSYQHISYSVSRHEELLLSLLISRPVLTKSQYILLLRIKRRLGWRPIGIPTGVIQKHVETMGLNQFTWPIARPSSLIPRRTAAQRCVIHQFSRNKGFVICQRN